MKSLSAPIRTDRLTPLRYPGGKGKLTAFIRQLVKQNQLGDVYAEPYAGGAGIAINLLLGGDVSNIRINDLSRPVYAFWKSLLENPAGLSRLIVDTPLNVAEWDRQKSILTYDDISDPLSLGFAMFFLNRTNRSGILNGGPIGGRDQSGFWKIDARYNTKDLVERIDRIAQQSNRIEVTNLDALEFLKKANSELSKSSLIYLDPPYYVKGRDLYYHFYRHDDHEEVADAVADLVEPQWLVSYDNIYQIRDIYKGYRRIIYDIGYSARSARRGSEIMFFADGLKIPALSGAVVATEELHTITA